MKKLMPIGTALLASGMLLGLSACVDHDYDLSNDIDLTVAIGGDATLPGSNTEIYTLSQLLDLSSTSSIKPVAAGEYGLNAGDYVLTQTADPTTSTVEIDQVRLKDLQGDTYRTPLDPFANIPGLNFVSADVKQALNTIDISDNNVDKALLSLSYVTMNVPMEFTVGYESNNFSGAARIDKGFTVTFDPSWTITITDAATAAYARLVDSHTIEFYNDITITGTGNQGMTLKINLTAVDLDKLPQGQGLYAPGKFKLESQVSSSGSVSLRTSDIPTGGTANLTLITSTKISNALILSATGRINPDITINPTSFKISGVPDFLSGEENNLDLDNPQLYLDVNNNSPVAVEVSAMLTAVHEDGSDNSVGIGSAHNTAPIIIEANGTTRICLSRTGRSSEQGVTNIAVDSLSSLIQTVPDHIDIKDISAKAVDRVYTIELGHTYSFTTGYEVIVPLQFGADLKLVYSTTEDDWGTDLDKYNFNTAVATLDAINTVPLDMKPDVVAIDRNGLILPGVRATVDGTVAAGTIANPTTSHLTVTLESEVENLSELDGVRFEFVATTGSNFVGQALNENQYLKFENIKVGIRGGVIVDLN